MVSRYLLYLLRWQLSTPILAVCLIYFKPFGDLWSTVIANLIGGLIFFWIDRIIFTRNPGGSVWEVKQEAVCVDCGATARVYRLVKTANYDRSKDTSPKFRCEECSAKKAKELADSGVIVE